MQFMLSVSTKSSKNWPSAVLDLVGSASVAVTLDLVVAGCQISNPVLFSKNGTAKDNPQNIIADLLIIPTNLR